MEAREASEIDRRGRGQAAGRRETFMRSRIIRTATLTVMILALSAPMMALTRDGGNRDQQPGPIQKIIRVIKRLITVFDQDMDPTISVPKP
jgi:hypothetical protein